MTNTMPQVLMLRPKTGAQAELLEDLYDPLFRNIQRRFRTTEFDFTKSRNLFAGGKPSVVLAVDGELSKKRYDGLVQQLAQYTLDGGTVICCCLFSNFCTPPGMANLFTRFGLQWKSGDYHRTTFSLNKDFKPVFGAQLYSSLESSYCVKALHVKHVPYNARIYSPTEESRMQSAVFPPGHVDQAQSPAVLTSCGKGFFGYLGDVNNEEGTQALLMAMIEKITNMPTRTEVPADTSEVQTSGILSSNPGCFVCGKLQPIKTCARCRKVQYCSPGCQKAGWKMYKETCNKKRKTPEEEEEEEEEEGEGSDYDE